VPELPNLDHLSHAEKDALIRALWQRLEAAERRIAELEARLAEPGKTPDNSSLPPSKGQKPNQPEKTKRAGPRQGSLGRRGGGRPLALLPDETVTAKAPSCTHCRATLTEADQVLGAPALIRALWQRLEAAERRIAELEARLAEPGKTPDNSSLPPSKGQKPNQPEKTKRAGPRQGSLGRRGGGRPLALLPDETVTAKAPSCTHCRATLTEADQVLGAPSIFEPPHARTREGL
jgi:BMFP domain-containing protein YqiC